MNIIKNIYRIRRQFRNIESIEARTKVTDYNQKALLLKQNILYNNDPGISSEKYCNHDIVVSLTSYGKRIYDVSLTIESIMEQTMKANRILLWLDHRFEHSRLPASLSRLKKRGLEIRFCKDIRSYKKLIPTLSLCPNDAVITIDDDLLYEYDLLERLINAYLDAPQYIHCCRYHRMILDKQTNKPIPYNQWAWCQNESEPHLLNFPTGGGGTLYPPHSLDDEVTNDSIFMQICPYADDIWFKAMALKKGTLCKKVYTHNTRGEDFIANEAVQDEGLFNKNVAGEALNDKQLKAVFEKYDLYKLLK